MTTLRSLLLVAGSTLVAASCASAQCYQFSSGSAITLTVNVTALPPATVAAPLPGTTSFSYLANTVTTLTLNGVTHTGFGGGTAIVVVSGTEGTGLTFIADDSFGPDEFISGGVTLQANANPAYPNGLMPNGLTDSLPALSLWTDTQNDLVSGGFITLSGTTGTSGQLPITSISLGCTSSPPPSTASLYLISPFLLGAPDLSNIDLSSILPNINWTAAAAAGLVADNTSAAIAIFQTTSDSPVTFTTTNSTTLLPYTDDFLALQPTAGSPTLTVSPFFQIGAAFFAAALVQAPTIGASSSYSDPVTVTAMQGNASPAQAAMVLVPPPVILVHGLWGNRTSLQALQDYLTSNPPWQSNTALVQAVEYSPYLGFSAPPLAGALYPVPVSVLQTTIRSLNGLVDQEHIVGGRVDIVAHSMGGLVSRYLASMPDYRREPHNRYQGAIHEIVTLDTPEDGSELASFLIANRNHMRKAPVKTGAGKFWLAVCGVLDVTVQECFKKSGMPLAAPGSPLETGAVFSLIPNGPNLDNPDLQPPNIDGAIWRAVTATAPTNSALEWALNHLIAALYKHPRNAATINSILGTSQNDAIVTVASQSAEATANQFYTFENLSHTSLKPALGALTEIVGLNDDSVLNAILPEVPELTACWLKTADGPDGGSSCLPGSGTAEVARDTPAEASVASELNVVDRLQIQTPQSVVLATPLKLYLRVASLEPLRSITLSQSDELGHYAANEHLIPTHTAGDNVYVEVIPMLLGTVTFRLTAAYGDGGVEVKEVTTTVQAPTTTPRMINGDAAFRTVVLALHPEIGTAYYKLAPQAFYASVPDRIDAQGKRHPVPIDLEDRASYSFTQEGGGPPVIRLQPNGVIEALRAGKATVQVRFDSSIDYVNVVVVQQ